MAEMVDAWKTLLLDYSLSSKLGSQTLGLITVLAISGSVVLLALGKQKLRVLKDFAQRNKSAKDISLAAKGLSFLISTGETRKLEYNRMVEVMGSSNSREENGGPGMKEENSVHSEERGVAPGLDVGDGSSVLLQSTSNEVSSCTECKTLPVLKKVRFSADVIEPLGNNREYRRRMKSLFYEKLAKERDSCKVTSDESSSENATSQESAAGRQWGGQHVQLISSEESSADPGFL